jgi:hypothetical protein
MFFLASLVVTFFTHTAAYLRALKYVRSLAECSNADSECLYKVQRWVYKRLLQGIIRIDVDVLELQATGLCRTSTNGTSIVVQELHARNWDTSVAASEVRCSAPATLLPLSCHSTVQRVRQGKRARVLMHAHACSSPERS